MSTQTAVALTMLYNSTQAPCHTLLYIVRLLDMSFDRALQEFEQRHADGDKHCAASGAPVDDGKAALQSHAPGKARHGCKSHTCGAPA